MTEIIIDNEFKNLINPLKSIELEELEKSILAEGIRDCLVTWQGILIDGHHRYELAQKHGLEYKTKGIDLPDRESAKEWILTNQLGRRNLTSQEASYYRGKLYESRKLNHGGDRISSGKNFHLKTAEKIGEEYGVTGRTIRNDAQFSKAIDKVATELGEEAKSAILSGEVNIPKKDIETLIEIKKEVPEFVESLLKGEITLAKVKQEIARKKVTEKLNNIKMIESKKIEGVYDVIVIDPPWQMKKIELDVAPNQVEWDYPTMTINEIKNLEIPYADDCHVWLWTTHKYLPIAFEILESWNLKYICTFVWHKPGGFQPFGLPQYNSEFALYARHGTPKFIEFTDFKLCFDAPRTGHSEKPELFYDLIRRVTTGRRLDMFNRRKIEGFETWGKEAI